ncbi:hypothetical protein MTR67_048674 [Solanum verrucosum]|uniref:Uncharacterized protein n=1 Tax=Solanum verrucosum TaxID=315347 RepID=A0AAF0V188_SOLVR|nr:hypothetical protein MTR67_048674 [Solanum verrucosum]
MEGQTGQQEELFVEIDQKTDDQAYSDGEAASCTTDGNEIVNIIARLIRSCKENLCQEVVENARSCYVDGSTDKYNDHEFALMMLLDACFIINHIELSTTDTYNKLRTTRHHLGMLALSTTIRDMFLLENQIPFWILKLLISLRYDKDEGDELLEMLLNFTLFGEYEQKGEMSYNHVERASPSS